MTSRSIHFPAPNVLLAVACLVIMSFTATNTSRADDFAEIEKTLGVKGQVEEGTLVVRFPRRDLRVTIDGETIPTGLGLGSWIAWRNMGDDTMLMGDLVLLEKEVNPVLSALQEVNINITALHNHFIAEQPRIMFMHIDAMGKGLQFARGIKNALSKTGTPQQTGAGASQPALMLDTRRIENIVGHSGSNAGGSFKITVGRSGVKSHQMELTSSVGMNSWAGFVGSNKQAHVAGVVVMTATEVNRVIRTLRNGGIEVVAIHNHMLDEEPRMFFLHYWGTGPAEKLAQAVREALDEVEGPVR